MDNTNRIWKLPNNFKAPFKVFDTLRYDERKIKKTQLSHFLYIPLIKFIFFLKKINVKFIKYPEYFGHQNFDMEYFYRMGKNQKCIYIFLKNKVIINEFLLNKHKTKLTIFEFNNKFFKCIESIDKISLRNFGSSIFDRINLYSLQNVKYNLLNSIFVH